MKENWERLDDMWFVKIGIGIVSEVMIVSVEIVFIFVVSVRDLIIILE